MNPSEAATVLAVAATLDPRLRPPSPEDAKARATVWAATLDSDMRVDKAQHLVSQHYKESTESLMPAHLNRLWRQWIKDTRSSELLAIELADTRAREALAVPMPKEVREQLNTILRKRP